LINPSPAYALLDPVSGKDVHTVPTVALKVYTLGLRDVPGRVQDALGSIDQSARSRVTITAHTKQEAAVLAEESGLGFVSLWNPNFAPASHPVELALLEKFPHLPQVYATRSVIRPGDPVVLVDDTYPQVVCRISATGRSVETEEA
jgi:hypothetical protein